LASVPKASFDDDGLRFKRNREYAVARILRCKYGQKADIFIGGMIMFECAIHFCLSYKKKAPDENTHLEHAKALSHRTNAQRRGDAQTMLEDRLALAALLLFSALTEEC